MNIFYTNNFLIPEDKKIEINLLLRSFKTEVIILQDENKELNQLESELIKGDISNLNIKFYNWLSEFGYCLDAPVLIAINDQNIEIHMLAKIQKMNGIWYHLFIQLMTKQSENRHQFIDSVIKHNINDNE